MRSVWINISLGPDFTHVRNLWEFEKKTVVFMELEEKWKKQTRTLSARVDNLGMGLLEDFNSIVKTHNNDHMDLHTFAEPGRVKPRLSSFVHRIDQEVLVGK